MWLWVCVVGLVLFGVACAAPMMGAAQTPHKFPIVKTDAEWKKKLSPEAYDVLRHAGTEAPESSPLDANHLAGIYYCQGCGYPLFSSEAKFDSGTGWPSFFQPIYKGAVLAQKDLSLGMDRDEVVCSHCGGHLGHVFDDGPRPTGLRYCMNGVALDFKKGATKLPAKFKP
jgi:peptide-methionine (R)-S-oxide reductase